MRIGEETEQVWLSGLLEFGMRLPETKIGAEEWLKQVHWRIPAQWPEAGIIAENLEILTAFIPHESGDALPVFPSENQWNAARLRAFACGLGKAQTGLAEYRAYIEDLLEHSRSFQVEAQEAEMAGNYFLGFREARKNRRYAHAEELLGNSITWYPDAAFLKVYRAWFRAVRGHTERALLDLQELPAWFPAPSLSAAVHALCLIRLGHAQQALEMLQQTPGLNPMNPELNFCVALGLGATENWESMDMFVQRMLKCRPYPEGALRLAGRYYEVIQQPEAARRFIKEAHEVNDPKLL